LSDDDWHGEFAELNEKALETFERTFTTEFENWIVRICLGGAGCRPKNQAKAITGKHTIYTMVQKCDPSKLVHSALWQIAQPLIGDTSV
jgi:hypothetical protein